MVGNPNRARDAYNAHFYSGSMSYGIADYSNQLPHSVKHIPPASSIHNYASGMGNFQGQYHPPHGVPSFPNSTSSHLHAPAPPSVYNDNSFSFSNPLPPKPMESISPESSQNHSWSPERNSSDSSSREKLLQPFYSESNPPPDIPIFHSSEIQTKSTRRKTNKVSQTLFSLFF